MRRTCSRSGWARRSRTTASSDASAPTAVSRSCCSWVLRSAPASALVAGGAPLLALSAAAAAFLAAFFAAFLPAALLRLAHPCREQGTRQQQLVGA